MQSYRVCVKRIWLYNCLCSSPSSSRSRSRFSASLIRNIRKFRSKKLFYRPLNSQYNSVVCSCRKETFLVYCFSEQVARLIPYRLLHKYSHLFICMSIKETLSSGQKPVYTLKTKTSEQIAYAAVHYFGQVFVFSRLIDKSVLE